VLKPTDVSMVADEDLPSNEWIAGEIDRLTAIGSDSECYTVAQENLAYWRTRGADRRLDGIGGAGPPPGAPAS
jgi:hypothetical protein